MGLVYAMHSNGPLHQVLRFGRMQNTTRTNSSFSDEKVWRELANDVSHKLRISPRSRMFGLLCHPSHRDKTYKRGSSSSVKSVACMFPWRARQRRTSWIGWYWCLLDDSHPVYASNWSKRLTFHYIRRIADPKPRKRNGEVVSCTYLLPSRACEVSLETILLYCMFNQLF